MPNAELRLRCETLQERFDRDPCVVGVGLEKEMRGVDEGHFEIAANCADVVHAAREDQPILLGAKIEDRAADVFQCFAGVDIEDHLDAGCEDDRRHFPDRPLDRDDVAVRTDEIAADRKGGERS